jgi:ROS/MUCR transcriptional regulator protein
LSGSLFLNPPAKPEVDELDARSYRTKYGIPEAQTLSARATAAKRRQIASEVKPWEKSPQYIKAQEERAATAKKSGRKKGTRKG